jgi:hypothetical protein
MELAVILAAIRAGVTLIPEGLALVEQIKGVVGENDQVAIDAALVESTAAADAQHNEAQGI